MKKGLILVNAYNTLNQSIHQANRLKEEFNKLDVFIDILKNDSFLAIINDNGYIKSKLNNYDFCIYLNKDKYISLMLEKNGLRLFNSHDAIVNCDDKMTTSIILANHNIPLPKTLPGLLCYNEDAKINIETILHIEEELNYPLIMKHSYGSLGKGVFKINNREELINKMEELKCKPHLFQEFISYSEGKDIRVITIGQKVVASMLRKSSNGFRSNIALGGKGYIYNPPQDLINLCEKVSKILNLDYGGIDILIDKDNYKICEVNSNAFFEGVEKVTGINVAKSYAEYIYKTIYK